MVTTEGEAAEINVSIDGYVETGRVTETRVPIEENGVTGIEVE